MGTHSISFPDECVAAYSPLNGDFVSETKQNHRQSAVSPWFRPTHNVCRCLFGFRPNTIAYSGLIWCNKGVRSLRFNVESELPMKPLFNRQMPAASILVLREKFQYQWRSLATAKRLVGLRR